MTRSFLTALLLLIAPAAHANEAVDWATGHWGIDVENVPPGLDAKALDAFRGCKESPVIITADPETLRYKAVHTGEDNFVAEGPILKMNKRSISLQYDDEIRLMKSGEKQIWHMFFVTRDKFFWVAGPGVRSDQREYVVPTARIRCQFAGV